MFRKLQRKGVAMTDVGLQLELRVVRLMRLRGHLNVRRSVRLKDCNGHWSEIDVISGIFRKIYIECKNYSRPVPLKDVAKFKEVLKLNGIPISRGLFITNSTYTPRATQINIKTIDGTQLMALERFALLVGAFRWSSRILIVTAVFCISAFTFYDYIQKRWRGAEHSEAMALVKHDVQVMFRKCDEVLREALQYVRQRAP